MVSTARCVPSVVTMPSASMRSMASVTSSTFGRLNVGYHSFDTSGRLHPCGKSGVSLARTSGSSTTDMLFDANSCAKRIAFGSENVIEPSTRSQTCRRASRSASGSVRNRSSSSGVYGSSILGSTQFGVRWKTVNCPTLGAISGTNCTALAALPTTATRSPAMSCRVVPAGGVEHGAGELVETRDVGPSGIAEHADRSDDDVELVLIALLGGEPPHRALVVPADRGDAVAEVEVSERGRTCRRSARSTPGSRAVCRTGATSRA